MRNRALLIAAPLLLAVAGCQRTMVDTGLPPAPGPHHRMTVMGFASGLIMPRPLRLSRACRGAISRVWTEQTLADFAVQTVTAGILSPRTVTVVCAGADIVAPAESRRFGGPRLLDRRWEHRRMLDGEERGFHFRDAREHRRHFRRN